MFLLILVCTLFLVPCVTLWINVIGLITSFEFWPLVARKDYLWRKEHLFRGEPINYEAVDQNVLYIGKNTNQLQSKHSHEGNTLLGETIVSMKNRSEPSSSVILQRLLTKSLSGLAVVHI